MKGTLKILVGLIAIAAIAAPAALAQCPQARVFGGNGGGMFEAKINIIAGANGAENAGNEVGYFWENGNAANDNMGGGGVGCPSSLWWVLAGPDRRIDGAIATPTCQMDVCPSAGAVLNNVVEDVSADGQSAFFIMFQVDETPPAFRWWDHARITPGFEPGVGGTFPVDMIEYPIVNVAGSSGPPPGTTVTNGYANVNVNYHGVQGAAHTATPASTGIAAYDIMGHHGASAPNRTRGSWNLGVIAQVAYADAAVAGHNVPVPCPNPTDQTYLGVGIEFADGVKSALVGRGVAVSCNPSVADPDDSKNRLRPKSRKVGRSGR